MILTIILFLSVFSRKYRLYNDEVQIPGFTDLGGTVRLAKYVLLTVTYFLRVDCHSDLSIWKTNITQCYVALESKEKNCNSCLLYCAE